MTDKKEKQSLEEIKENVTIVERRKIVFCFVFLSIILQVIIKTIMQILLNNGSLARYFFFPPDL